MIRSQALKEHVAACTATKDAVVAELANVQVHLQEREVERHQLESQLLKLKEELLLTQETITQQRAADALVIPAEHPSVVNETASHDNQLPAVEEHRLAAAEEELAHLREVRTAAACTCGSGHGGMDCTSYLCLPFHLDCAIYMLVRV